MSTFCDNPMNSCVNLNIKNMRKVKEKQKKIVSQQNKIKQLKTIKNKSIQREERRGDRRRGDKGAILPPHFVFLF